MESTPPKPVISNLIKSKQTQNTGSHENSTSLKESKKGTPKQGLKRVEKSASKPVEQFVKHRSDSFSFDSDKDAKFRKNERERRRRLMVSQGFSDLVTVLNLPETAKVDKATVLNNSIKKIQTLQTRVDELELEIKTLKSEKTESC